MTDTPDRRHDLTDRMADFLLAQGLSAATLRPMAAAAGVSDRMLLYYFKDKSQAMTAAFDCVLHRLRAVLAAQTQARPLPIGRLRGRVIAALLDAPLWPFMQLWLDVTAHASRGDPVQRDRGQAVWTVLQDWVQGQLVTDEPHHKARMMMMIQAAVQQKALGLREDPAEDPAD